MFTLRSLRWLSVAASLAYVVALALVVDGLLKPNVPDAAAYVLGAALAMAGVVVFASIVFDIFQRVQARVQRHADELQALYEAGVTLTSEMAIDAVLQKLVDVGRTLTKARYGALSVLSPDGDFERFLTAGITEEERLAIGQEPRGRDAHLTGEVSQLEAPPLALLAEALPQFEIFVLQQMRAVHGHALTSRPGLSGPCPKRLLFDRVYGEVVKETRFCVKSRSIS